MKNSQLENTISNLKANNFEVFMCKDIKDAKETFQNNILAKIYPSSASYGDSLTMKAVGALDILKNDGKIEFIDTFSPDDSWREQIYKRKEALTVDLFLTGTNAITEEGMLVNLDMIGNRVAAITFGPKNVVIFAGVNKIVSDLSAAMERVKKTAAPKNAIRHDKLKLPCQTDGKCHNCKSPQRICNSWTITEKSYPKGRIKIVLIEQELGY